MELSYEQRLRVQNFVPGFYKFMLEGTISHCRKLASQDMREEAIEILRDFKPMTRYDAEILLDD